MPKQAKRALTVGGAVLDTFVVLEQSAVERVGLQNADRSYLLLQEGMKVDARSIRQHPGGGAVNTAIAFARLGFDTALVAKVGIDPPAATIRHVLGQERVGLDFLSETRAHDTGASVLVLSTDRNAAVLTARGANGFLEASDFNNEAFNRDIVYISGLSNDSARHFASIAIRSRSAGAFVAANPGARQLSSHGGDFWTTVGGLSLLSVNSDEAALLIPQAAGHPEFATTATSARDDNEPRLKRQGLRLGSLRLELDHFMRYMLSLGTGTVLVTDGAHGAFAASGDTLAYCASVKVPVEGTTGAGDAFSSTFAAFASQHRPVEECLWLATVNAAAVVGVVDANSGLLTRHALTRQASGLSAQLQTATWKL